MKVLQVVPQLSAGGVERTTIEIAQALTAAGHEAHVASAGGRLEAELAEAGGILHLLPVDSKNPFTIWQNASRLGQLIDALDIDIVHVRSRAPALSCAMAVKTRDAKYVTTYHGIYNATSALKRWYNASMTRSDAIIANSQFTADHIIAEHGTDKAKITVIARGVDMARFDPAHISAQEIAAQRAIWNVPPSAPLYLLPGRLTGWKGQKIAIAALAQTDDKTSVLVCLGDAQGRDDYVGQLWDIAYDLGVTDRLRIPGHSADMPVAYSCADYVLSCSTDPEAFGRVAAEAQAMGKWVIASDHGGARETVIDGVTGARVTPSDVAALATALTDGASRAFSPKTSRAHIMENFSDTAMQDAVLQLYDTLLSKPR
ncbi:glycosyltransferase family 4 protein [Robiginitomaculum antarcticum]|uniref:glycosyltransferase family 4 protein n=1 Tax=Robiginitomaculum antarcticum TaxID=437507 RepID=UPI0003770BD3|nr:glycosyltransferase family 4 protein [Robiginitomaculum antarcticum]